MSYITYILALQWFQENSANIVIKPCFDFPVFYHLCYEGSVDLAAITDLNDRLALEVQITEFGQVPKQLFSKPHPQRSRSFGVYDSMYLSNGISESSICNEVEEERLRANSGGK